MEYCREELNKLVDHYGYQSKGTMLVIDASNDLLKELNSAPDNLGSQITATFN